MSRQREKLWWSFSSFLKEMTNKLAQRSMFLDQRSFLPQDVSSRQFNEASKVTHKGKSIFSISYPSLQTRHCTDFNWLHTSSSENVVSSVKANVAKFFLFSYTVYIHNCTPIRCKNYKGKVNQYIVYLKVNMSDVLYKSV